MRLLRFYRIRHPWRFNFLVPELLQIVLFEPRVLKYVLLAKCAQSCVGVLFQQAIYQIDGLGGHRIFGERVMRLLADRFIKCHLIHSRFEEGILSLDQLVDEDTQAPVVCRHVMATISNDLWWQIVGGATERVSLVGHLFGESKICYHGIPVAVDQNVLWLQITVHVAATMHERQRVGNDHGVELSNFANARCPVAVLVFLMDDIEKLTSRSSLHQHGNFLNSLKRVDETHDKRMLQPLHHFDFTPNQLRGIGSHRLLNRLHLQGVILSCCFNVRACGTIGLPRYEPNFSEQSRAQDSVPFKIIQRYGAVVT
mmetsp:Transcript_23660/g.66822  ORF Transcript_23660/g.66822 Transcript_23660/m.66822 type:complete len:312 (-) Transcript_23660:2900-3835(-)